MTTTLHNAESDRTETEVGTVTLDHIFRSCEPHLFEHVLKELHRRHIERIFA